MTHLVRLRCTGCGRRVGWIDRNGDGLWLVAHHHAAAPGFDAGDTAWAFDRLPATTLWECLGCRRDMWLTADEARTAAGRARHGKVPTVRVPTNR